VRCGNNKWYALQTTLMFNNKWHALRTILMFNNKWHALQAILVFGTKWHFASCFYVNNDERGDCRIIGILPALLLCRYGA
jgi:hypothetical protein